MTKRKKNIALSVALSLAFLTGGAATAVSASAAENNHANCENYCLVCDVAAKVNALPDVSEITIENAAAVTQQIHNIDRVKFDMTDEEYDEFELLVDTEGYGNVVKYDAAVKAVRDLRVGNSLAVSKSFSIKGGVFDTSEAEVSFSVTNVETAETTLLTLFDLGASVSSLGAEYYEMTADGWTFQYDLPAGTYEIKEVGLEKAIVVNGQANYFSCASMSDGKQVVAGNGITVTLSDGEQTAVTVLNSYAGITYAVKDENGNGVEGVVFSSAETELATEEERTTAADGTVTIAAPIQQNSWFKIVSAPEGYCYSTEAFNYTIDYTQMKIVDDQNNEIDGFTYDGTTFTYTLKSHSYENGFCTSCDGYQPATEVTGAETVYQIENAGQLYWFAQKVNGGETGINGVLTKDITVNENVLTADGGLNGDGANFRAWTPIGEASAYTGKFVGSGYVINGLYFNDESKNGGLFASLDGSVQGVGVQGGYIKGSTVGGIAATSEGTVLNSYNGNSLVGVDVGGIVGVLRYNTVAKCYNEGKIEGSGAVGGVVAKSNPGTVEDCYNVGQVSAGGSGIVGYDYAAGTLNCYYLEGSASGGTEGADVEDVAVVKTAEAFASGEVAYLLNGGVTDGTQSYYQTLGEDNAPKLSARGTVYYGYVDCAATEKSYANTPLSTTVIPHSYGELVAEVVVTCEADGLKAHYHCSSCGQYFDESYQATEYEGLIVPMLGHAYGEWEILKEATMNEGGERKKTCANCGDEIFDETPSNLSVMIALIAGIVALAVVTIMVSSVMVREEAVEENLQNS